MFFPQATTDDEPRLQSDSEPERDGAPSDDDAPEDKHNRNAADRARDPVSELCGTMPDGCDLNDIVNPLSLQKSRSSEAKYVVDFIKEVTDRIPTQQASADTSTTFHTERLSKNLSLQAADEQKQFFEMVDRFTEDPDGPPQIFKDTKPDALQGCIDRAITHLSAAPPRSRTSVVQAALFLLERGVLNIPDVGCINVKQARALLWNALWLQDVMNREWELEDPSSADHSSGGSLADGFQFALMGPGGTGKTAVLRVTEALVCYFCGPDTVRKCAPSNSAARLIGGDTLHALCKLPFGDASIGSKKAHLSLAVRERHKKRWETARACFVDEVSMISADQLHQAEVRIKSAKDPHRAFGGLGMTFCGDFLQLPPVDPSDAQKSLATDLDDTGILDMQPDCPDEKDSEKKRSKHAEVVQGLQLWKRIRRVVCLDVNVRAPGPLSRLLAEMRAGAVSDEMWSLYCDRIMQPNDPRLTQPESPFSQHEWQFIVHRHKIRVYRSLENAKANTCPGKNPLYIVQAMDDAVDAKDRIKMPNVRKELLGRVSPRDTQGIPGLLPLYVGMRLTLQTKDRRHHKTKYSSSVSLCVLKCCSKIHV